MYPKPSVVPPGGFHYVEKHKGTEIRLTAESVDTLAAAIEKYRLTNGIPLGDAKKDVVDYICGNWPHFCNENENTTFNEGRRPGPMDALSTRVAQWMTRLWNIGAKNFVSDAEAKRRAEICSQCSLNSDFRQGGCKGCVQGTDKLAFIWSTGKHVAGPVWDSLKACRATGAHLQAGIFAEKQPDMSPEEQLQLSPQCWRRT